MNESPISTTPQVTSTEGPLTHLYRSFQHGSRSPSTFIARATSLCMSLPLAMMAANTSASAASLDALFDEAGTETDSHRLVEIFVRMNDIAVQDVAGIPLIQRSSAVFAIANNLDTSAIDPSSFELPYWNIANWTQST